MFLFRAGITLSLLCCIHMLYGQQDYFNSFVSRLSDQYKVEVALAPELLPELDSLRNAGADISTIEELLQKLLKGTEISYQIIDGNKILLRREYPPAQKDLFQLKGRILDDQDKTPLPFAAISLEKSGHGTFTDLNGDFILNVHDTAGLVNISYLGFKTQTVPASKFFGNAEAVRMEVSTIPLEQVVIIVPFHAMSPEEFSQSVNLNGFQFISGNDLLSWSADRLINKLTGYTHFSSEQGIRIRSSDAENALILMDQLPVYDPYHFYNIFGPFNGYHFSSVQVYKNNMPVEYGGRIDGMIKVKSAPLHKRGADLLLDTDLLLSSLAGRVAISDKVQLLGGVRVSHTGMLNQALSDTTTNFTVRGKFKNENEWTSSQEPTFNFYDINLGLTAEIGTLHDLTLTYFKNKDYLENAIYNTLATSTQQQKSILIRQSVNSRDDWGNEGIAAGLRSKLGAKTDLHINGFISSFKKNISYTSVLEEKFQQLKRTSMNSGLQNSVLQSGGLKILISTHHEGTLNYTAGAEYQHHTVDLLAKENTDPYLLQVQAENEMTIFGEQVYMPNQDLQIAIGGRLTYLTSTRQLYVQPNARIQYSLANNFAIKSAYSKNMQAVRELTVENRFGREAEFLALSSPESGYPVLQSDKYMIGGGFTSGKFFLDAELYYKTTSGLINVRAPRPDPSFMPSPTTDFYRFFVGEGWTGGLDILSGYKTAKTETSVSYTLSKISQTFDMLFNGRSFSPKEDRRHQVKLASQYKPGKFTLSGLLTYKTKAPYVSLARLAGSDDIGMVDQQMIVGYIPAYFSLDLGVDYSFRLLKNAAQIGASLINATNHKNINDLQHLGRITRAEQEEKELYLINETELLGRTFNVHFRYYLDTTKK